MPYSRRLPRIASTGRIALWLNLAQRDFFLASPELPKDLGHALHRAPVRNGKLTLRVKRESLEALIRTAAAFSAQSKGEERAIGTLLRYLESLEDRFETAESEEDDDF